MTIRADITDSHARVWEALAEPGAQLTGRERVKVAEALRATPVDCAGPASRR